MVESTAVEKNNTVTRLTPEQISAALAAWMPTQVGGKPVAISDLIAPKGTGYSNQTILFSARWDGVDHAMVLQAAPSGLGLFARYDFGSMAKVQQQVRATSTVPVSSVRWHEVDTGVLGVPFYIMDRVQGRAPTDKPPYHRSGWFAELSGAEQAQTWWSGIDAMVKLHALDVRGLGFDFLSKTPWGLAVDDSDPALTRIEQWRKYLAWADPEPLSIVDTALAELIRTRPRATAPLRVHWGDAKLSNCMVDNARVSALLDWELCGLSLPEEDLAHWLMLDWSLWNVTGCTRLPSLPSPVQTVARYEELSGYQTQAVAWWFRFGLVRLAIIYHRIMTLVRARGHVPAGKTLADVNPILRFIAPIFEQDKLP